MSKGSSFRMKSKVLELCVVLSIAFLPSIILSFYLLSGSRSIYTAEYLSAGFHGTISIVQAVLPLSLLAYVLFRNGRSLKSLGLTFKMEDLRDTAGLTAAVYILYYLFFFLLRTAAPGVMSDMHPRNYDLLYLKMNVISIILIALIPLYEELIVRAYLITEIGLLTGNFFLAGIISVLVQFSYHLYQGLVPAVILLSLFVTYTVFYVKFKRITPVILSHIIFDAVALFFYTRR